MRTTNTNLAPLLWAQPVWTPAQAEEAKLGVDEQARLDLGLAWDPVHGASDAPPKGRHLHPFDWINTPARLLASRPDTATAWPVVVARVHMHLGPRRTRRPAFGASDGPGNDAFGLGPVGQEAAGLPAQRMAIVPALLLRSPLDT